GHALESFSMQNHSNPCFHGEAVAMGMIAESHISYSCGKITESLLEEIVSFIALHYQNIPFDIDVVPSLLDTMKKDKKNTTKGYNFTLLDAPGKACYDVIVEEQHIINSLEYLHQIQF
ncbi:MAG: 3-dehydroquinate synthase, partial [Granulosicoccus sp.]